MTAVRLPQPPSRPATLMRLCIWVVTIAFVVMMFYPLVTEMIDRLSRPPAPDFPY